MNTCEALSLTTRVASNKRSAACDLNGEMVILQLDSGIYFGLNAVGAFVWECIQTGRPIEDVIRHLLVEYDVSREVCELEVLSLLQSMSAHGLIEIQPESASDGAAA